MNRELARKIVNVIPRSNIIINNNFIVGSNTHNEILDWLENNEIFTIDRQEYGFSVENLYPRGKLAEPIDKIISEMNQKEQMEIDRKEQRDHNEKTQHLLTRILQELIRLNDKQELKEFVQSLSPPSKSLE